MLEKQRFSSNTTANNLLIQKFCCRRTACVEQFTAYYKTDHQLQTVEATSENTFIQGLEIAVHCDS